MEKVKYPLKVKVPIISIRNITLQYTYLMFQVENALASTDYGKDLSSARALLKKHQLTEVEIKSTGDRIATLQSQCEHFNEIKHFDIIQITETTEKIVKRFDA